MVEVVVFEPNVLLQPALSQDAPAAGELGGKLQLTGWGLALRRI
jgi:hypothetical protein